MDLTVTENERVLKEVCGSFVVLQTPTVDINGYFDWTKLHVKALIEDQLKETQSTKVIMILWVRCLWNQLLMM